MDIEIKGTEVDLSFCMCDPCYSKSKRHKTILQGTQTFRVHICFHACIYKTPINTYWTTVEFDPISWLATPCQTRTHLWGCNLISLSYILDLLGNQAPIVYNTSSCSQFFHDFTLACMENYLWLLYWLKVTSKKLKSLFWITLFPVVLFLPIEGPAFLMSTSNFPIPISGNDEGNGAEELSLP